MNPNNGTVYFYSSIFIYLFIFIHGIKEISCNVGESEAPILEEEEASSVIKKNVKEICINYST